MLFSIFQTHGYGIRLYPLIKLEIQDANGRWRPDEIHATRNNKTIKAKYSYRVANAYTAFNVKINNHLIPVDQYHKLVVLAFEEREIWDEKASMKF
jgi:hypothetical protein